MRPHSPFSDLQVIDLGTALPGPLAAARLAGLGAKVTKVEPPWGDLFEEISPQWYAQINRQKKLVRWDLKTAEGQTLLAQALSESDVLIVSNRPSALQRMGLQRDRLEELFPRLCCVAIVGEEPPRAEQSGHDLTYQAQAGLLQPPRMPRFLLADLLGAERAVQAALHLLLERERKGCGGWKWVSLTGAAKALSPMLRFGVTAPDGILGGNNPRYGYYRASDGWLVLAAIEERLWSGFLKASESAQLRDLEGPALREALQSLFARRSCQEWQDLARKHQLPLQALK